VILFSLFPGPDAHRPATRRIAPLVDHEIAEENAQMSSLSLGRVDIACRFPEAKLATAVPPA
jgi:hypothetical protein